jgi:hypothetical protein
LGVCPLEGRKKFISKNAVKDIEQLYIFTRFTIKAVQLGTFTCPCKNNVLILKIAGRK